MPIGSDITINKDNIVESFDNNYIIYSSKRWLNQTSENNNLNELLQNNNIPLTTNFAGTFSINMEDYSLTWLGAELILTPNDSYCSYLKLKNKSNTDLRYYYKKDGSFSLGESGSIYIYEFGFGMLKNDTYLWKEKQTPFDLINSDISAKYTGDGNNSYNRTSVGVIKKDYIGRLNQVVLTKFRVGDNINNKEYISGYFQENVELYPYKNNDFGYYSQLDRILQKSKYFNLGELEVIGTNFYNRNFDFPNVRLNGNNFIFQPNNQTAIIRDIGEYHIYLCYVPPLTLDSQYSMKAPAKGMGSNSNTITMGSWRTYDEDFEHSSRIHVYLSEAKYNIKLAMKNSTGWAPTVVAYKTPKYYKLDRNGNFSWKDCSWIEDNSINFNRIIGTHSLTLQYNLNSCYDILKGRISSSTDPEDFLYWSKNLYNRFIIRGGSFTIATTCFSFSIQLGNVPYFIEDDDKHIYKYTSDGLGIESYISPGRVVSYGYNPDYGKPYVGQNDNAIWWSRRKFNESQYVVSQYAELPKIDLSNQTIYRSTTSLLKNGIFGTYSCHESGKQISNSRWVEDEMQLAGINDTTTEGFYCLFALKKEK